MIGKQGGTYGADADGLLRGGTNSALIQSRFLRIGGRINVSHQEWVDERPRNRIEHEVAINDEHLAPHHVKAQLGGLGAKPSWCFAFDRSHRLKRRLGA